MSSEIENEVKERMPGVGFDGPVDEKFAEYVHNLMSERDNLDPERYPLLHRLVKTELENISKGANGAAQENPYIDLYNDAPITLYVKALPPSKIFPKFNYAGRIIGPKGTYLKSLMKETMTKMILLGKGVMKDKEKEEELKNGSDPKYFHLNEEMHVAIQVTAPAAEAYARVAYAITCLKQQVLSDNRTLEGLPWIASATRILEGGGAPPSKYSRPSSVSRPNNNYDPPQRVATYEYPEEPQYRRYSREGSPPTHRSMDSSSKYGESYPYRRQPQESSRAMEFIDKARNSARSHSNHASRGSPPPPMRSHSYAYEDHAVYEPPPMTSSQHYYADSGDGRGSWSSGSHNSYKSQGRGGKYSHPPRYAPYKKYEYE